MKTSNKFFFLALLLAAALLCSACSSGGNTAAEQKTIAEVPVILNQAEYVLYQNIFYNEYGAQYENTPVIKNGVFAIIQDGWAGKARYYVWGYLDNTQCCDWQWEIAPSNLTGELPAPGSLVEYTGMLVSGAAALDQYWFAGDDSFRVITEFTGKLADVDMTVMNGTLERVQIINMQTHSDWFEGKTVKAYGRVASLNSIQHPYYDGDWQQPFESMSSVPAIGTEVIVSGTFSDAVIKNSSVTETTQF